MTLEGDVEASMRELGQFCARRRLLIVLDDASDDAQQLAPGGRRSTLIVRGAGSRPALHVTAGCSSLRECPLPADSHYGKSRQAEASLRSSCARPNCGKIAACSKTFLARRFWILESWGRLDEARRLFERYRALYEDQMQLSFVWNML